MHRTQGGYFCLTKQKIGYSENSRTHSRECPGFLLDSAQGVGGEV
ncbi:uncharacterized protein METZ01_LOCUS251167, partial [marine metagenome]